MTKIDKTKLKKEAMIEALTKSLGNITMACKSVGISRETFYKWLKKDSEFAERVKDIDEITIDYVENALFKLIKEGNPTAILFFLKTKGKHRGYQENYDVTSKGEKIQINISDGRNKSK